MRHSTRTGLSFGLTSATITTLGLMVGLNAGTHSTLAVIGGVLTIAVADACSDALGIHISEESENVHTQREVWESTISTFLSKFVFAITFAVPLFLFDLPVAVIVAIVWGLSLLTIFSYFMAREQKASVVHVVGEHLTIAVIVIIITNVLGGWISATFGTV